MKLLFLALGIASSSIPLAVAKVTKNYFMDSILQNVREGDLVVFDIDDTLMTLRDGLINSYQQLLEKGIPEQIAKLQKQGIEIIAVTTRPISGKEITLNELNSMGFDFKNNNFHKKNLVFEATEDPRPVSEFYQGVLFVGHERQKGPEFARLLATTGKQPKRVLFVDDIKENIDSMSAALEKLEIPYESFWYQAVKERIGSWTPLPLGSAPICGRLLEFLKLYNPPPQPKAP